MAGNDDRSHPTAGESFEEFKHSFSYGSRTDLNFKFLKGLSDDEASSFFQELLWRLGTSFNDGTYDRLIELVYEWQIRSYNGHGRWTYEDGPFTHLKKPLAESKITLITSSGHFIDGQDPAPFGVKNMTQENAILRIIEFLKAAPALSEIPFSTLKSALRVRQPGYDVRAAEADPNCVFPTQRLLELEGDGLFGELAASAYSFVGVAAQKKLMNEVGPQWVSMIQDQAIDAVLLVPV